MDAKIIENHKRYLERKALFKKFGYDVDKERRFILEQAEPVRGRILEAGTGKGHFSLVLAKAGYSLVSFDISAEEQAVARMNLAYFGFEKAVDLRVENGEKTSFVSGSFNTVFSVNVLHHLQNAYLVLDELRRVLSPEGKLVLADFNEAGFRLMDKIHGLEGNTHSGGKVSLRQAGAYLSDKGFFVRNAESAYQCVLIAGKRQ